MASSIVPLCHYGIICVTIYSKHGRRVVPLISHCALAFLYPRPPTEQTNPNQRKHQAGPRARATQRHKSRNISDLQPIMHHRGFSLDCWHGARRVRVYTNRRRTVYRHAAETVACSPRAPPPVPPSRGPSHALASTTLGVCLVAHHAAGWRARPHGTIAYSTVQHLLAAVRIDRSTRT